MPFLPLDKKWVSTIEKPHSIGIDVMQDVIRNDAGHLITRPGLKKTDLTGADIQGIFFWPIKSAGAYTYKNLYVIDGEVFIDDVSAGSGQAGNLDNPQTMSGTVGPDSDYFYLADGQNIVQVDSTGPSVSALGGSAPLFVTHLAFINQRIVALSRTIEQKVYWSAAGDGSSFDGSYFTPELENDHAVGLWSNGEELMVGGNQTIEFWYNSGGENVFARYPNSISNFGVAAHNSVAQYGNGYFILDSNFDVQWLSGRQSQIISAPVRNEIYDSLNGDFSPDGYGTQSARLVINRINNADYLILRELVYDIKNQEWFKWTSDVGALHTWPVSFILPPLSAVRNTQTESLYVVNTNSTYDDYVGEPDYDYAEEFYYTSASVDYYSDVSPEIRTGWIDWGKPSIYKTTKELLITIGCIDASTAPSYGTLNVYYRDNGDSSSWVGPRTYDFYENTDQTVVVRMPRFGRYRSRQWKFTVTYGDATSTDTGRARLYLASVEEILA